MAEEEVGGGGRTGFLLARVARGGSEEGACSGLFLNYAKLLVFFSANMSSFSISIT
jgi:hypothetical protein